MQPATYCHVVQLELGQSRWTLVQVRWTSITSPVKDPDGREVKSKGKGQDKDTGPGEGRCKKAKTQTKTQANVKAEVKAKVKERAKAKKGSSTNKRGKKGHFASDCWSRDASHRGSG